MKKFIFPSIIALAIMSCNNKSESTQDNTVADSTKKVIDSAVAENANQGTSAGNAAGNSNANTLGTDTAAVGTNPTIGKDTTHK